MWADIKFALRTFAKAPGFVAVAVLVTALGIGANTAIFSVVRAVILRTLPFRDPQQLVMIWEKNAQLTDFLADRSPVALQNYLEWKKSARSFGAMTILGPGNSSLTGVDKPEEIRIAHVPSDFGEFFGVRPELGRMFALQEPNAAVISHQMFQRIFGADPKRLGSAIELEGAKYTVIGVWPRQFQLPAMWQGFDQPKADVWLPLNVRPDQPVEDLRARLYFVYGRLRAGVSLAQARAEMDVIGARARREYPEINVGFGVNVFPISEEDVGPSTRRYVLLLQGAVALVLLIACANVANLLLARAVGRRKEAAVRIALGASRWRLARQGLIESLVLACGGAALGLLLAYWAVAGLSAIAPHDTPHLHDFRLDSPALVFTALLAIVTGLIFGLAPSLDAIRRNVNEALNQGGRSGAQGGSKRLRSALVAVEVALALVLLVGAGLLIRTIHAMFAADPGFRRDGLLTLRIAPNRARYVKGDQIAAFCRELLDKAAAVPGVLSISAADGLPTQDLSLTSYTPGSGELPPGTAYPMTAVRKVTESYFQTMLIPLVRGRAFTRAEVEDPNSKVIVVNQAFAMKVWPGEDAIGKAVKIQGAVRVVIGVAGDAAQLGPDSPINPEVYVPSERYPQLLLVARIAGNASSIPASLADVVRSIDRNQAIRKTQTMNEALGDFIEERRFVMGLLGAFAALALALAAAGIYGVLAYSVTQRTREIGIRMAVGASASDVLKLILREALGVALIGVGAGIAGAFAMAGLLKGLLFGVSTTDPWTLAAGAVTLLATAAAASIVPARRAAMLAPLDALRQE